MAASTADRVKALEQQLALVQQERDDLQRDVESLCMQVGADNMFSTSYVISDRLLNAEKELRQAKAQLARVCQERDNLREDMLQLKNSKRTSDKSWQSERERTAQLESELDFFKSQATKAMGDRDKSSYDAQLLRNSLEELQRMHQEVDNALAVERAQRQQLQAQLSRLNAELETVTADRDRKAAEVAQVPQLQQALKERDTMLTQQRQEDRELRAQISLCLSGIADVESRLKIATANNAASAQKAAAAEHALAELQKRHDATTAEGLDHRQRVEELEARLQELQLDKEQLLQRQQSGGPSLSSGAGQRKAKAAQAAAQKQQEQLRQFEVEIEELKRQKMDNLQRLADAQVARDADRTQLAEMQATIKDLTTRLAQATEEKVEALMRMALTNGGDRSSPRQVPPQAPRGPVSSPFAGSSSPPAALGSISDDGPVDVERLQASHAQLVERLRNLERFVLVAHKFRASLQGAARVLDRAPEAAAAAAARKQAGEDAQRVLDACLGYRTKAAITPNSEEDIGAAANGSNGDNSSAGGGPTGSAGRQPERGVSMRNRRIDKMVAAEVLDLVEVGARAVQLLASTAPPPAGKGGKKK